MVFQCSRAVDLKTDHSNQFQCNNRNNKRDQSGWFLLCDHLNMDIVQTTTRKSSAEFLNSLVVLNTSWRNRELHYVCGSDPVLNPLQLALPSECIHWWWWATPKHYTSKVLYVRRACLLDKVIQFFFGWDGWKKEGEEYTYWIKIKSRSIQYRVIDFLASIEWINQKTSGIKILQGQVLLNSAIHFSSSSQLPSVVVI